MTPMELAFNTIHCKDCIEGLNELHSQSVDLAFADPPFNIGYEYDVYDDSQDYERYLHWTRQWMAAVCQILKPTGSFWAAIGDEYAAEMKLIAQRDLELTCRSWVVWYYTFGVNCTKKFSRSHAHLFHFVKDPKKFTFNDTAIRVPSARQMVYADGRAKPEGRLPDDTWILRPQDLDGFKPDEDTWYFPRVAGTFKERAGFHGCQMPEQLLGRIIRLSSNPGDLVLDPFAGSGTTLAVAKKLGRRWIGFEISEKYAQKARDRINKALEGQALAGASEPLVSAPKTPKGERINGTKERSVNQRAYGRLLSATGKGAIDRADIERGIIAAFLASNQGFSTDRVICDRELNEAFVDHCRRYGLPGEAALWNRTLLRVRKAAKLASLPRPRRTSFPYEDLDSYIFASEIAIRMMLDEGSRSLDEILCNPPQADKFDEVARRFAPGFSSLQYRWAALRIRKRAKKIRAHQVNVPSDILQRKIPRFQTMGELELDRVKSIPGVYLLRSTSQRFLYAGETVDLAARMHRKMQSFSPWQKMTKAVEIGVLPLAECENHHRLGLQSVLIKQRQPEFNYLKLGLA
jgi:site-specific DNA-methyltransferase (adenine-specific)